MTPRIGIPGVRVTRKGADRMLSGHPWIFAGDVAGRGEAAPGDVVRVLDPRGQMLGLAHFSSTSQICLRLLSPRHEEINRDFFLRRLRAAQELRSRLVSGSDAYRLVHGEADLLPGLVVDRYREAVVVQTLNQGMDRIKPLIVECLLELTSAAAIVARNDVPVRAHESLPLQTEVLWGAPPERTTIRMNNLTLEVDLLHGQKTGVFLDQRENYLAAARYARGRALDCFASTGGFSLHMAPRCESVEAVDSSAAALATATRNRDANGHSNIEFSEADVFDYLYAQAAAHRRFSTIVLDPPAFAKSRTALEGAARGYREINRRALEMLEPGGILVTCSCSHHLSESALLQIVAEAALDAGKMLRVLERRTQSLDHPILLTVPETHYLKCLILQAIEP
ncbi:MAG TPA: class I SAM-dependent rRNA methyltransferase [Bryobacteraceae bacterium]|nr:class I SAM-dependent rRNA methyltransferase [Bryobacteraceae bacterium]